MSHKVDYRDYVGNEAHMQEYRAYQKRYAVTMRESDRVLIELARKHIGATVGTRLLDVGCSTGNLLLHLKHAFPELELHGADLEQSVIEANRREPALGGIEFSVIDLLSLGADTSYDIVTLNAILFALDDSQFEKAVINVVKTLSPGGALMAFDLFHPFEQKLEIIESTRALPNGLKLTFRSQSWTRTILERSGLGRVAFYPFSIPIDLPRKDDPGDITTYTRTDGATNERLCFRGALYQPWCHVVAQRA